MTWLARAVRRTVDPDEVLRPGRRAYRAVRRLPGGPGLERAVRYRVFRRDLRSLNDALADTPIAGRYWVWSGLLLGWAREGDVLRHDADDADFAYLAEDREAFCGSVPALVRSGFSPLVRFRNGEGVTTQFTLGRHGSVFDFFELEPTDAGLRYFTYGLRQGGYVEIDAVVPRQDLVEFSFLGRRWMKVADHDRELTALYGDWRVPRPDWDFLEDDRSIREVRAWAGEPARWDGSCDGR